MDLQGSVAVVSGGAGNLGRILLPRLLSAGARIAVPVRGQSRSGVPAEVFQSKSDLTVPADVIRFVKLVSEEIGPVDILIHLAGLYFGGVTVEETNLPDWERVIGQNLTSAFLCAKAVLPEMKKRNRGRIVGIGALPVLRPAARRAAYSVAKQGVVTLMRSIAEEVKGTGVTANAIIPGTILTDENRASMPDADISQWVTPESISDTIIFLCSRKGEAVNGAVIPMVGGF